MKVLFCASEVVPFAKTGGLADVAGALPLALEKLGIEVHIAMPKYGCIDTAYDTVTIGDRVTVHFIKHDGYFDREGLYGTVRGDYPDNLERFSFFCHEILELIRTEKVVPDIIHCHDWQTALIPIYLNTVLKNDVRYSGIRSVFTIHNLAYQGLFPAQRFNVTGLPMSLYDVGGLEYYGNINFLKGALLYADMLTTVSSTYAAEIQTKAFGCGLEGIVRQRSDDLYGILNGIDQMAWNPATDRALAKHYTVDSWCDKVFNKRALQKELGLALSDETPLIGIISRLCDQKGFDILADCLPKLFKKDIQFVLLGTGEARYHAFFEKIQQKYPDKASINLTFDEVLAEKIYAGSDIFVMPSRYEPCGLGQLIALRYGTIPVVRQTGGLADTIIDGHDRAGEANGFVFKKYSARALMRALDRACEAYSDKAVWSRLIERAMTMDFSWDRSAGEYRKLYEKLLEM